MKRILLILALIMLVTAAYGQPRQAHQKNHRWTEQIFHGTPDRHDKPHKKAYRKIHCNRDWQKLPNGCHVRLWAGSVRICKPNGDRLLSGEDVWLLPSGYYSVREMSDFWHIYDPWGERIFGLSSHAPIQQVENGYFIYKTIAGGYRVADRKGEDVFGLSGDEIVYVGDGIFRVKWAGSYRFYDERGNHID